MINKAEKAHLLAVKSLPCGVCEASPPCDAHHITQNGRRVSHYATIPLCRTCHDQVPNGAMWRIYKKTELLVLAETIERLIKNGRGFLL